MAILRSIFVLLSLSGFASANSYVFEQLEIEKAWAITKGSRDVKVAILGTGIDYTVPELARSIALNHGELGAGRHADGIDNDGNGYVDDVYGANTYEGTGDPMDSSMALGSYAASLLVSLDYGIAPNISIIPVNIFNSSGSAEMKHVEAAFDYALSRGADIILLQAGPLTGLLCQMIDRVSGKDVLVVSAAGSSASVHQNTCKNPNLLVTAASDEHGELSFFTNYGSNIVHIAAPGVNVSGLGFGGKVVRYSSGSSAAALAAGVAALVKSQNSDASAQMLKNAIINGATPSTGLFDKVMSSGVLSAAGALHVAE